MSECWTPLHVLCALSRCSQSPRRVTLPPEQPVVVILEGHSLQLLPCFPHTTLPILRCNDSLCLGGHLHTKQDSQGQNASMGLRSWVSAMSRKVEPTVLVRNSLQEREPGAVSFIALPWVILLSSSCCLVRSPAPLPSPTPSISSICRHTQGQHSDERSKEAAQLNAS